MKRRDKAWLVLNASLMPVATTTARTVLARNFALRITADYDEDVVTQTEAGRALRRTRGFLAAIEQGGMQRDEP